MNRWWVAAALLTVAAACSGGDRPAAVPSEQGPAPSSAVVVSSGPPLTSQVMAGGGGAASTVEVRVRQILTDLQAKTTPEGTVITLPERVLFDFDQAMLRPDASASLDRIAEVARFYATAPVSIRGHTDGVGTDAYNDDLSRRRATAVRDALARQPGIDASRLEAVGLGKRQPVVPNTRPDGSDDPAARQQNRRVEVVVKGVATGG